MDVIQKATVDMLTNTSVSILTQKFVKVDGKEIQLGANHRKAYVNTEGRGYGAGCICYLGRCSNGKQCRTRNGERIALFLVAPAQRKGRKNENNL